MIRLRTTYPERGHFIIRAYDGASVVGGISVIEKLHFLEVGQVNVKHGYQKQGIGTQLYQEAARIACEKYGKPLRSPDYSSSPSAKALWRRAVREGRAVHEGKGPEGAFTSPCPQENPAEESYMTPEELKKLEDDFVDWEAFNEGDLVWSLRPEGYKWPYLITGEQPTLDAEHVLILDEFPGADILVTKKLVPFGLAKELGLYLVGFDAQRKAAVIRIMEHYRKHGDPLVLVSPRREGAVYIHPSTRGGWQGSKFDKLGPWGHTEGKTVEEVVERLVEDGFTKVDPEGMTKIRMNPPSEKWDYQFACPDSPCGELIHYITDPDRSKQISYATFAKWADLAPLRQGDHPAMYRISASDNWAISFHKSVLPSGMPIVYFDWSRIEHVFAPGYVNLDEECRLALESGL